MGKEIKKKRIINNIVNNINTNNKNQNGNVLIVSMLFVAIAVSIIMFIVAIFMSNVNGILYGVKTDMYLINKAAVVAVNKNQANIDNFTYSKKEYKKFFKESLMKNYDLNENLENKNKLIKKIEIEEYEIYQNGTKDNYTGEKCDDITIHTVVKIKIKPIILSKVLEDVFNFQIHEDVNLNLAKQ